MRLVSCITILLVGLSFPPLASKVLAQSETNKVAPVAAIASGTDTVAQENKFFLSGFKQIDRPGRAALMSAIIPGAGQVYNKSYWKVPIIYATGGMLAYYIVENNNQYQGYKKALEQRSNNIPDKYMHHPDYSIDRSNGTRNLRLRHDEYRRKRDLTIGLAVLAYGANIAEAYVHAHLKGFDVSETLSLRVQPSLLQAPFGHAITPGMAITLHNKTK